MPVITKVSAITIKISEMQRSMRFYRDILGLRVQYGSDDDDFSSLNIDDFFLNLEVTKEPLNRWGRIIFYCDDVDEMHSYLQGKGYDPQEPKDSTWGERFFHMNDPDGNELSFAKPITR